MAYLKAEVEFDLSSLFEIKKMLPSMNGRLLSLIGKRARTILKEQYLSGQELTLNAFPRDKIGRYTITSDVNRNRNAVKIYSYPVNLFEYGRMLRSGKKEPGKHIITRKLKQAVYSGIGSWINEAEKVILEDEIKKAGLK